MTSLLILPIACTWFRVAQSCFGAGRTEVERQARTLSPTQCPKLVGDPNFDLNKFSGEWYGVSTSSQSVASSKKCIRVQVGALKDGLLFLHTSLPEKSEERVIVATKFKEDCEFEYKFHPFNVGTCGYVAATTLLQTIMTDYDSYALIYSCVMKDGRPIEQAALLSRTPDISDEVKNTALSGTHLQLYTIPQTDCNC